MDNKWNFIIGLPVIGVILMLVATNCTVFGSFLFWLIGIPGATAFIGGFVLGAKGVIENNHRKRR